MRFVVATAGKADIALLVDLMAEFHAESNDALFAECRERGVLAVHVEVGHDNDAAGGLYEAFGMRSEDRLHLTARL